MKIQLPDLKRCPSDVRNAILLLWTGWAFHFFFYFSIYLKHFTDVSRQELLLQFVVAITMCYYVGLIRKWARMLSLFFNLATLMIYGAASLRAYSNQNLKIAIIAGVTALLFAGSTYFLLKRSTARYFNELNPSQKGSAP